MDEAISLSPTQFSLVSNGHVSPPEYDYYDMRKDPDRYADQLLKAQYVLVNNGTYLFDIQTFLIHYIFDNNLTKAICRKHMWMASILGMSEDHPIIQHLRECQNSL